MFYTANSVNDLACGDLTKVLYREPSEAIAEGTGNLLALDLRYLARPGLFRSEVKDGSGRPLWEARTVDLRDGHFLVSEPIPRWLAVPVVV